VWGSVRGRGASPATPRCALPPLSSSPGHEKEHCVQERRENTVCKTGEITLCPRERRRENTVFKRGKETEHCVLPPLETVSCLPLSQEREHCALPPLSSSPALVFRVQGLRLGVSGFGFRVSDVGFRVKGFGCSTVWGPLSSSPGPSTPSSCSFGRQEGGR